MLICAAKQRRLRRTATGATSLAARRSTSARRSASSPPSRSASRAPSSRCGPSTSAARRSSTSQSNLEALGRGHRSKLRDMPTITDPRGPAPDRCRARARSPILDMDGTRAVDGTVSPYGAHLMVDERPHRSSRGERIAEWDPSFTPGDHREVAGTVKLSGPDREPDAR